MTTTTKWIAGSGIVSLAIYLLSPGLGSLVATPTGWEWREQIVNLSGVTALILMTLTMVVAVRPSWLDRAVGGLDKAYGLHKWAGIFSTIAIAFHWLIEHIPKIAVMRGRIAYPGNLGADNPLPQWQIDLFESSAKIAEWGFFALIVLVIIALFQKIPYRWFRTIHKIFPIIFLTAAFHAVTIMVKTNWWSSPAGYLVAIASLIGTIASFISLAQKIGASRKIKAVVESVEHYENGIIDVTLSAAGDGFTHIPGQFAFVSFEGGEPHPFTIASSGDDPHTLRFAIKALGDHTGTLQNNVEPGQVAEIEGPYGQFHFDAVSERQIWIAGGIGVTPFLARLEALANKGGSKKPVDFWYCVTTEKDAAFPDDLDALCQRAGVTLHRMSAAGKQFLNANIINDTVQNLKDASVWFCGPESFARSLIRSLGPLGLKKNAFHHDNFNMR